MIGVQAIVPQFDHLHVDETSDSAVAPSPSVGTAFGLRAIGANLPEGYRQAYDHDSMEWSIMMESDDRIARVAVRRIQRGAWPPYFSFSSFFAFSWRIFRSTDLLGARRRMASSVRAAKQIGARPVASEQSLPNINLS